LTHQGCCFGVLIMASFDRVVRPCCRQRAGDQVTTNGREEYALPL
jgi:hypothetical protein